MPASAMASRNRRRLSSASDIVSASIAVIARRGVGRHQARGDVALDLLGIALAWIAPAAAAGGAERQTVAGRKLHARRLQELLRAAIVSDQRGLVNGAGLAALQAPRRILGALVVDVG